MASSCIKNEQGLNLPNHDYKQDILDMLFKIKKQEIVNKNKWKVKAYTNAISEITKYEGAISSIDDIKNIKGIGKSISTIIEETLTTGTSNHLQNNQATSDAVDLLMKVHGIGQVKALELVTKFNIDTIEKLEERKDLLNNVQLMGLKYYKDIEHRIPFKEMVKHDQFIQKTCTEFADKKCKVVLAGSYRRKNKDSGDIDVLMTGTQDQYVKLCNLLKEKGYIKDVLAFGPKKFMGICKLKQHKTFRRIDIMFTEEKEFPFAILYFTGSQKFNINMRNIALEKGYSLNEYGLKKIGSKDLIDLNIFEEKDVFDFLDMEFVPPDKR